MQAYEQTVRIVLESHEEILVGILYGSAASGRMHQDSDVDVAISAGRRLTPEERLKIYGELCVACGREIDLVDLETAQGLVLREICREGILVKKSDSSVYANLIIRMLDHEQDMMPNIREIWKQRREQFLS